jgi:hypothetical protein
VSLRAGTLDVVLSSEFGACNSRRFRLELMEEGREEVSRWRAVASMEFEKSNGMYTTLGVGWGRGQATS